MKIRFLLSLIAVLFLGIGLQAQTFVFNYQGELNDGNAPANGVYDFRFKLTDQFGAQVGNVLSVNDVTVTNGIFTVQLGFGATAFDGGIRRLEISVKKDAETNYTTLSPAQTILDSPYAIRSFRAGLADIATNATNATNAQNAVNALNATTANNANFATNAGRLDGLDSTDFARINNGTISGDTINAENQYDIAGERFIYAEEGFNENNLFIGLEGPDPANVTEDRNTIIGYSAAKALTDGSNNTVVGSFAGEDLDIGISNAFFGAFAGAEDTVGSRNSFFGSAAGRTQISGNENSYFGNFAGSQTETGFRNTFIGSDTGITNETGNSNTALGYGADVGSANLEYATAIGARSRVFASNTIALGRPDGSDKVVIYGIGSGGAAQLCRNGSSQISFCSSSLRYKENIHKFNTGLNLVKKLNPISFDWKQDGTADLGLGAEDVAEIEPLLVTYNDKGEVEGVKYDRIGVVLLNAVKEQQTQIENQEKEKENLKEKLETQEKQIESQQKQINEQQTLIEGLREIVCSQNPGAAVCSIGGGENEK